MPKALELRVSVPSVVVVIMPFQFAALRTLSTATEPVSSVLMVAAFQSKSSED